MEHEHGGMGDLLWVHVTAASPGHHNRHRRSQAGRSASQGVRRKGDRRRTDCERADCECGLTASRWVAQCTASLWRSA